MDGRLFVSRETIPEIMTNERPNNCVVCKNERLQPYIKTKDYFLTLEDFELWKCPDCELLTTWPVPSKERLQGYYLSEEYSSHHLQTKSFRSFVYRLLRSFNLRYKHRLITKHIQKGQLLDLGCGTGDFLSYCLAHGWTVDGVEPNLSARKLSEEKLGISISDSKEYTGVLPETVDVITMWHSLEHITDPVEQLVWNYNKLRKNGLLVLALPNYLSWDSKHFGKFWAAYDTPRHLFHFSMKAMETLAKTANFRLIETKPMFLDAFYISLLSGKYRNDKSGYFAAFFNGLKSNVHAFLYKREFSSMIYLLKKA